MDDGGNAVAVWSAYEGSRWRTGASRHDAYFGWWGGSQPIDAGTGDSFDPRVGLDGDGNALVVWERYDTQGYAIVANRFEVSTGWDGPRAIGTDDYSLGVQLAVDARGNALAVWGAYDGSTQGIRANNHDAVTGWGTAYSVTTEHGTSPHLAMDAAGNALLTWTGHDGQRTTIMAKRFGVASGWSAARLLHTRLAPIWDTPVALDSSGRATVVWSENDEWGVGSIWANRLE